jgi:hypothetical protein
MIRLSSMLVLIAACAETPATPSFQRDIAPILAARCVRCHGEPPIGDAPDTFRLDGYPDRRTPSGMLIAGAGSYAALIASRATARTMPPRFPLDDDQIAILQLWSDQTDGRMAARGEPRSGNRAPEVAVRSIGVTSWEYDLHDPDGDLVVGTLRARPLPAGPEIVVANLHSGRDRVMWNTAGVAAGMYLLEVNLDDGGVTVNVESGTVEIP